LKNICLPGNGSSSNSKLTLRLFGLFDKGYTFDSLKTIKTEFVMENKLKSASEKAFANVKVMSVEEVKHITGGLGLTGGKLAPTVVSQTNPA